MFLFLISVLYTPIHAVPLPQKQLTLSQFRAEGSRSLEPISNFVIISPSYRQVRRQGRKGESLPIKFPTLKVRDPNELNVATNREQQEDSGPVFGSGNSLATEDIESKIREINASIETEVPKVLSTTEKEVSIESQEDLEVTSLPNTLVENVLDELASEEVVADPIKRIVVSIKTFDQNEYLEEELIKNQLENLSELDTSVYINELDTILQSEFNKPGHLIYVDAKVDDEKRISGNVFSAGRPLENLESLEYEEALSILNKVSQIIDESLALANIEEEKSVILSKKIIVAIRTAVFIDEESIVKIKDSLEEAAIETAVFVNAPEEVIRNEFANPILPIFVSISIDIDNLVGGNVYYNSVPLEDLIAPESEEASDILITVKDILEESILVQIQKQAELAQSSISEQVPIQEAVKSKKVVISLKSNLILTEEESAELSRQISSQIGIGSILLVNRPTEVIQEQLRGPTVPILLDMKIDQEYQLSGNIFYNYQPAENLNGQDFDEAMNILAVVKEALTEKINNQDAFSQETTEISFLETTTELDLSELVDSRIVTTQASNEIMEDATAEPEPTTYPDTDSTYADTDPTPEPEPEPESEPEPAASQEYGSGAENLEVDEVLESATANEVISSDAPKLSVDIETATIQDTDTATESLYFEQVENIHDYDDVTALDESSEFFVNEMTISSDSEEGSGYFPSLSDNLEVIKDTPNVVVEVFNHGVNGVTEVPGRSKSATPGVDFGLIQEITNN